MIFLEENCLKRLKIMEVAKAKVGISGGLSQVAGLDRSVSSKMTAVEEQRFGHTDHPSLTPCALKPDIAGLMTFPENLMTLLQGSAVTSVMWWLPEGDCFCFLPETFGQVLSKHFHGTKFESFTRKLNRW
jgi:HSF-type DNA-binding